jgi:hypothetical protein
MSQSLDDKMFMFFQAIDSIRTGNDGTIHIKWKNNVIQEIPGNNLVLTEGFDVLKAKEIHLNPNNELSPDDIDDLHIKVWEDQCPQEE